MNNSVKPNSSKLNLDLLERYAVETGDDEMMKLIRVVRAAKVIASHYPDIERSSYTASLAPYIALRKALEAME